MSDDGFLDQLRNDARALRYEADAMAMNWIAAKVRARIAEPTPLQFIARWFRPLAASLSALALAGILAITLYGSDTVSMTGNAPEVSVAGDVFSVVD